MEKEEELKQLKSEVAVLERKIQLTLVPPQSQHEQSEQQISDKNKENMQVREQSVSSGQLQQISLIQLKESKVVKGCKI